MARIKQHIFIRDEAGVVHSFGPGVDVPVWASRQITNPDVLDQESEEVTDPSVKPPKAGKGATVEAWAAYAGHIGMTVPEDAERGDIIALVEAHEDTQK